MIFRVSKDASCSSLQKRGETSLKIVGNTKEVPARVTGRVALELVGGSSGSDAEEPADSSESGHDEVTTRFGMWSSYDSTAWETQKEDRHHDDGDAGRTPRS